MLLGPVRVAAADGSWAPALAETILAMIFIGGLEGLFITMLPLRFLDGATVMAWSRIAWALVFGTVTFLWWQLLLNQEASYVAALEQTNVQVVLSVARGLHGHDRWPVVVLPVQAGVGRSRGLTARIGGSTRAAG